VPADRIDWQAIKARWSSDYDQLHLALLPKGFASAVLAIAERFQWEATYRINDYDYSDWDELQAVVDLGIGGLTDTMRLSDLIGVLDGIEPALEALLNKEFGGGGCCPDDSLTDFVDGTGIVGDVIDTTGSDVVVGVGSPPVSEDWQAYAQSLCDAAAKYADGLGKVFDVLESLHDALKTVTLLLATSIIVTLLGLLGISAAAAGVLLGVVRLVTIAQGIRELLTDGDTFWDDYEADITAARQDIICAIITSDTPGQAAGKVRLALQNANEGAYRWLNLLTFIDASMERVFAELSDAAAGFGDGFCGTCDTIQLGNWEIVANVPNAGTGVTVTPISTYEAQYDWLNVVDDNQSGQFIARQLDFRWMGEDCAEAAGPTGTWRFEFDIAVDGQMSAQSNENGTVSRRFSTGTNSGCTLTTHTTTNETAVTLATVPMGGGQHYVYALTTSFFDHGNNYKSRRVTVRVNTNVRGLHGVRMRVLGIRIYQP
jgi:hypothetical protein